MEKICNENTPIRPTLAEMSVGDVVFFPISRLTVIRSTASTYGLEKDRYYKARTHKEDRTVSVERTR